MSGHRRAIVNSTLLLSTILGYLTGQGQTVSNLVWRSGTGFRFAALPIPTAGHAGFTLRTPIETGVTFSNRLADATVAINRLLEIGSGVALGDIDGDGWVDIYFSRLEGDNVLYRNLGNWRFEDVTSAAGVSCAEQFSTGCVFADIDGDNDLDLLVNSLGGGTRAFLNDGKGHFTEMKESGLIRRFGATSMALADVDGDGDLDLYVTNYRTDTFQDFPAGLRITTQRNPDGSTSIEPRDRFVTLRTPAGSLEVVEKGEGDLLYINRGGGKLFPARWDVGVFLDEEGKPFSGPPSDWGLAVMFRDLNGDGLPDLYVCNDFIYWPDRIWLNQGGKRFQAIPRLALRNVSLSSMTVDVADINRDGWDDLCVADMLNPRRYVRAWQRPHTLGNAVAWPVTDPDFRPEVARNTLHLARGDGSYAEIAQLAGVAATDWTWSTVFLDVDLDGWEDLLFSTGTNHDAEDTDALAEVSRSEGWKTPEARLRGLQRFPLRATPSVALRNRHDLTFEDVSAAWGFNTVGIGHGMALGDLDNDGDLDVVVNCLNAPARLYRNESAASRVAVRLRGTPANTRGIGAKIRMTGGPVTQTQEMIAGGRYCSGDDAIRVFAAGAATKLGIEVTWRSGKQSVVSNVPPNSVLEIDETAAAPADAESQSSAGHGKAATARHAPLFEDVSQRLRHDHVDVPFDDFARQPLLARKLSALGPGVCSSDVNGDGFDDLIIAGGKAGRPVLFRNDGKGGFTEESNVPLPKAVRDETAVLAWRAEDGSARVILGESNWEDADTNAPPFRILSLAGSGDTNAEVKLSSGTSSTGPLALADVDGDGDLDLFLGGRVRAGRYPEAADSYLLRNDGGSYALMQGFPALGLVSGAVFTDFDSDGDPDLALACEWDSIRVFRNDRGVLSEVTANLRLARFKGFWNGIASGDFDGDGRLDLVASNWGRNWRTDLPTSEEMPIQLFYGDFADNGIVQTVLASNDLWLGKVTPWRERKAMTAAIPSIGARLLDHHAFGHASVQEVLGEKAAGAQVVTASTFDSMIFLNRGDHFEAKPLPIDAQFAPAFGVNVADFDGDGNEDLFLAQNFFGVDAETSRHDAGVGLILVGDGRGSFRALGPTESGVVVPGEQRGSAVADFDADGRIDLVVAQNSGATRLFRNARAPSGVRITLRGAKENQTAIGAVVRLQFGERLGPAREIHAGSGYWSQDSATMVFATPTSPTALQIRWPRGATRLWPLPVNARSVEVSNEGITVR